MLRQESSYEAGGERGWAVAMTKLEGSEHGYVKKFQAVGPVRKGIVNQLGVELDHRNNVKCDENYLTSVFAPGDIRRVQPLVA